MRRLQQQAELVLLGHVQPGRGFVQQQDVRAAGQGAGDLDVALVAVGQGADEAVGVRAEAHEVEGGKGAGHDFGGLFGDVVAGALGADHDVLEHGHAAEDADVLEGAGQAAAGALVRLPCR